MPDYTNYKVNGRAISDILEYSEDRSRIFPFNEFKNNNSGIMSFASFDSYYHPFTFDAKINYYFANKNISINKGCAAKGFAPVLNIRYETTNGDGGKDVVVKFKGTGNALDLGKLKVEKSDGSSYEFDCPTCIIIGLIGAGGGGAGGSGWWTGKDSYGGGCAALVALHIEMPYSETEYVNVLRIHLGEGGAGGTAWNSGSRGSETTLDFYYADDWHRIAYINGGEGGPIYESMYNVAGGDIYTDLAISIAYLNTVDKYIYGSQGKGRITIANSIRNYALSYGNYPYLPGNYYDRYRDERYQQVYCYFGPLTSAWDGHDLSSLRYIYYPGNYSISHFKSRTAWFSGVAQWFRGKFSIYGEGGQISDSSSGGTGGIGAGGGAGCPAQNIFDGWIGNGGRGGSAGLKLYW